MTVIIEKVGTVSVKRGVGYRCTLNEDILSSINLGPPCPRNHLITGIRWKIATMTHNFDCFKGGGRSCESCLPRSAGR